MRYPCTGCGDVVGLDSRFWDVVGLDSRFSKADCGTAVVEEPFSRRHFDLLQELGHIPNKNLLPEVQKLTKGR